MTARVYGERCWFKVSVKFHVVSKAHWPAFFFFLLPHSLALFFFCACVSVRPRFFFFFFNELCVQKEEEKRDCPERLNTMIIRERDNSTYISYRFFLKRMRNWTSMPALNLECMAMAIVMIQWQVQSELFINFESVMSTHATYMRQKNGSLKKSFLLSVVYW